MYHKPFTQPQEEFLLSLQELYIWQIHLLCNIIVLRCSYMKDELILLPNDFLQTNNWGLLNEK